jgi:hypothetical protein
LALQRPPVSNALRTPNSRSNLKARRTNPQPVSRTERQYSTPSPGEVTCRNEYPENARVCDSYAAGLSPSASVEENGSRDKPQLKVTNDRETPGLNHQLVKCHHTQIGLRLVEPFGSGAGTLDMYREVGAEVIYLSVRGKRLWRVRTSVIGAETHCYNTQRQISRGVCKQFEYDCTFHTVRTCHIRISLTER